MKTIVFDARMIDKSGIGTYVAHVLKNLIPVSKGIVYHIIHNKNEVRDNYYLQDSEQIKFKSDIYTIQEQIEYLGKIPNSMDLVWVPHYNIPLYCNNKLLVTIHDVFPLAMPEYIAGIHKRLYAKLMFGAVVRKANAIMCDSDFTRDELIRLAGTPRGSIQTVYLGVDQEWFDVVRTGDPRGRPYLLYIGNVKPHKNLARLIEAFSMVMRDIPHDLVIVGRKEGFITGDRQVGALADRLGNRVRFTGYVNDEDLKQFYAHAAALILPSLYEGFGLPPLEAMACGCPTLVSNVASLPEVCGDASLYCDPYDVGDIADKIRLLLSDGRLRDDLRRKGYGQARKFTWEKCAEQTMKVIESIL